jgi:hypothetical protein
MKRVLILISALLVSGSLVAKAAPSLGGSTGLIVTPSTDTLKPKQLGAGLHYVSESSAWLPFATVGIIPKLEAGGTWGIHHRDENLGMFHGKYRFYEGSLKAAGYVNLQFGDSAGVGSQWLVLMTNGNVNNLKTSFAFGKTFYPGNRFSDFDFSIGVEKILSGSLPWLTWMVDFSNYRYMWNHSSIGAAGRGSFNAGLRASINKGKLGFRGDLILSDFFDDGTRGIGLGASILYQL